MKKKVLTIMITAVITAAMVWTAIPAFALEGPADPAAAVEDFPTVQAFTDEAVAEADLIKIINAGINAPSAINQQPWHFSVVTDPAMFDEINGGDSSGDSAGGEGESAEDAAPAGESEGGESEGGESEGGESEGGESEGGEGGGAATGAKASVGDTPVAIIISCAAEATGTEPAFDAGLACMNMAIEAGLLGYGTKIVTSPTMTLNGARQDEFRQMLGIPADMTVVGVLLIGVPAQSEADIASSATARNDFDAVVTMITGDAAPAAVEEAPAEDAVSEATVEEEAPAEGDSAEGESPEGESAEGEAPAEGDSESAEGESPEGESPEGEAPAQG